MRLIQTQKKARYHKEKGFTLLEILIVVAILGILAGFVAVRVMDRPGEARTTKAMVEIETLEKALKLYKMDNGFYPSTDQGLSALISKPTTGRMPVKWREGGYLEKGMLPKDPWGREYLYMSPGVHLPDFDLWSYGLDGEEGGEKENADVTNWAPANK
ncbi:type II secretion system major pseudopilin GspG [Thermodesulfobacteriota bacterium]